MTISVLHLKVYLNMRNIPENIHWSDSYTGNRSIAPCFISQHIRQRGTNMFINYSHNTLSFIESWFLRIKNNFKHVISLWYLLQRAQPELAEMWQVCNELVLSTISPQVYMTSCFPAHTNSTGCCSSGCDRAQSFILQLDCGKAQVCADGTQEKQHSPGLKAQSYFVPSKAI